MKGLHNLQHDNQLVGAPKHTNDQQRQRKEEGYNYWVVALNIEKLCYVLMQKIGL